MSKIHTKINLPENWILEHKKHFDLEPLNVPLDYICNEYLKNKKIISLIKLSQPISK